MVENQVDEEYVARDPELAKYLLAVRSMDKYFKGFDIEYIERKQNDEADELAKAATRMQTMPPDVFYEVIQEPSIKTVHQESMLVNVVTSEDWMSMIIAYLRGFYEPDSAIETRRLQQRAREYMIINNELCKLGVCEPWLKWLSTIEGVQLLKDIHSGICGSHIGLRALASKAFRQGFYWPTAIKDETRRWRNKKMVPRMYIPEDLVLIRTPRTESEGKLEPKWEGPYIVLKASDHGAHWLTTLEGEELQHSWNTDNLRKFYV